MSLQEERIERTIDIRCGDRVVRMERLDVAEEERHDSFDPILHG